MQPRHTHNSEKTTQTGEGRLLWLPWGRVFFLTHTHTHKHTLTCMNLDTMSHCCLPLPWTSVTLAGSRLLINLERHIHTHTGTRTHTHYLYFSSLLFPQSNHTARFGPGALLVQYLSLCVLTHTCTQSQLSRARKSSSVACLSVVVFLILLPPPLGDSTFLVYINSDWSLCNNKLWD